MHLQGHIDQVKQTLTLPKGGGAGEGSKPADNRAAAIEKWITTLRGMQKTLLQRGAN